MARRGVTGVSGAKLVLLVGDSRPAVDRAVPGSVGVPTVSSPERPVLQQHETCIHTQQSNGTTGVELQCLSHIVAKLLACDARRQSMLVVVGNRPGAMWAASIS